MRTHKLRIGRVVLTVLVALLLLVGCNSGIAFEIGYSGIVPFGYVGGTAILMLEFVSSPQELKNLCAEKGVSAFDESSVYFTGGLSKKIRNYDEAYFKDKILIIYSFERGHRRETRIDSISFDREQITVNARHKERRGNLTDEAFIWLIMIEVNKADTAGASTIQIKYK
ncbi:MAG: hypothetical protein FWD49_01280 [Firmicutes bacterium]|nr:hypothetical protein [Bacillota bacterium]